MASITSTASPSSLFKIIETATLVQQNRLLPTPGYRGDTRDKGIHVREALSRLREEVLTTRTNRRSLLTVDAMLDARMDEWKCEIAPWTEYDIESNGRRAGYYRQISLRQALNIARNNFFNFPGCTWGPLWGSSTALIEVEKAVHKALVKRS